jgi:hypothetical protein
MYKITYLRNNETKKILWIGHSLFDALKDFIIEFNLLEKNIISIEFIED